MGGASDPWQREIHWRRLDHPARETAVLEQTPDGWLLRGNVAGTNPKGHAYQLDYAVECAPDWVTRATTVEGHLGDRALRITLARESRTGAWTRDVLGGRAGPGCALIE